MEENMISLKNIRRSFSHSGWALLIALLIPALLNLVLGISADWLMAAFPGLFENRLFAWAISFMPVYGIGIPLALLILRSLPADSLEQKKMKTGSLIIAFIMCFPMMLGGNLIGTFLAQILTGGRSVNNVVEIISQQDPLIMLTMILAAPTLEELLFRKFLIDRTARFGEKNAILFSALAFGMFHCNVYQIFYAFGIGLIFGYIYVRTRNIRYTMLLHFLINFLSGVVAAYFMGRVDPEMMDLAMNQDTEAIMKMMTEDPQMMLSFYASVAPIMIQGLLNVVFAITGLILLCVKRKQFFFLPQDQEVTGRKGLGAVFMNWGALCFFLSALAYTAYVLAATCP